MCLGIPAQIVELVDPERQIAKVDVAGVRRDVNVGLVLEEEAQVGDWVLIHVGFAISRIDEQEAVRTLEFLEQGLAEAYGQELGELEGSRIG